MRSLRSPPDYLHNTGIMRVTRSAPKLYPLDLLRNGGIMKCTSSSLDNIKNGIMRSVRSGHGLSDAGILRSLRSQDPDLRNTGILRSTRSDHTAYLPTPDTRSDQPNYLRKQDFMRSTRSPQHFQNYQSNNQDTGLYDALTVRYL